MRKYCVSIPKLVIFSFVFSLVWAKAIAMTGGAGPLPSSLLLKLGHFLLGAIFVVGGLPHFFKFRDVVAVLDARKLPAAGPLLMIGTIYQIVAGLLMASGMLLLPVALSLIVFTIVASFLMLDFWNKSGMEQVGAASGWLSNIGVVGGLILVAAAAISKQPLF